MLSGTFIQSWACASWTDERWGRELSVLKELGIHYIILGDSATRNTNGNWFFWYPTEMQSFNAQYNGVDVIKNALRNCQKYGMKVFVGVGMDESWWNNFVRQPRWLNSYIKQSSQIAEEIYNKYYSRYPDAFYGWYWPPEIWNDPLFKVASDSRSESIKVLAGAMSVLRDQLVRLNRNMPMLFSPFANTHVDKETWSSTGKWYNGCTSEEYYRFWKNLISQVSFLPEDILCPMDSIGGGGCEMAHLEEWTQCYYRAVVDSGRKIRLWSNCETFQGLVDGYPAITMDQFIRQIQTVSKYCDEIVSFAYTHYYSPCNVAVGYHRAYAYYLKYGELEKQKPSAPTQFTFRRDGGNTYLSWNAASDNLGVVGYNVYRNGVRISQVYAQRNDGKGWIPSVSTTAVDTTAGNAEKSIQYGVSAFDASGNESEIITLVCS